MKQTVEPTFRGEKIVWQTELEKIQSLEDKCINSNDPLDFTDIMLKTRIFLGEKVSDFDSFETKTYMNFNQKFEHICNLVKEGKTIINAINECGFSATDFYKDLTIDQRVKLTDIKKISILTYGKKGKQLNIN